MGGLLPELSLGDFASRLGPVAASGHEEVSVRLYGHYCELRKWNARMSLVGPGTGAEVVERHYAESLAGLRFMPRGPARIVDIGSGAGFPGWVLAAARPDLEVTLVEPSGKKVAFLESVTRKMLLSCRCLGARVDDSLPEGLPGEIDVVTSRALKLTSLQFELLRGRLSPGGFLVLWVGREAPKLPGSFKVVEEDEIEGSNSRRILVVGRRDLRG